MRLKFGVKRRVVASAFAISVALSPAAVFAESLGDALASAYKNSGLLDQNRANLRATDEGVAAAVSAMRPTIGYKATAGYGAVGGGAGAWTKSLEFSAGMTLFTFGKNRLNIDAAKETVLATRASLVAIEQDVLGAAISAYMDVRYFEAQANVRQNSVRLNQQNLRAAKDRFEVGEITRTEVSQVEAQLASANSLSAAAQGQVIAAREAYKVAIGNYPSNLSSPPTVKVPAKSADEAVRLAVQSHPAIKALQHRIAALDLAVEIAERGLYPTVSASASRSYSSGSNDDAITVGNQTDSFGIVASGTLYAGGNGSSAIRRAQANLDAARATLHTTAQQIEQGVRTAWSMLSVTSASSSATAASVQAQRVAYQGVKEEANLGASTTLDVLEAEQDLLNAQVLAIQARINSESAVFSLLSAMGLLTVSHLNLDVPVYDPAAYYNAVKSAPTYKVSPEGDKLDRVLEALGRN